MQEDGLIQLQMVVLELLQLVDTDHVMLVDGVQQVQHLLFAVVPVTLVDTQMLD